MKAAKTWKEMNTELRSTVAYIVGNTGRRAFDAVVVEIRDHNLPWDQQEPRRAILKTSGTLYPAKDIARCRRFCRRLGRLGVKFITPLGDFTNNGVRGTLFAYI